MTGFEMYQTAALAAWAGLGLARAGLVSRRGVVIVATDPRRTSLEMVGDAILAIVVLAWLYLALAYPWGLPTRWVPETIGKPWFESRTLKLIGAVCLTAGVALYAAGVWALGDAWRLGIDRDHPGPLTTHGIFSLSRNPIYVGIGLLMLGTALLQGRPVLFGLTVAYALLIHWTIRREESFLNEHFDDEYQNYCAHVGRYLTIKRRPRHKDRPSTGYLDS